nr:PREDICTED: poly [ADP-ribose] polymerase 10 [Apteryx mantelli mantelli]
MARSLVFPCHGSYTVLPGGSYAVLPGGAEEVDLDEEVKLMPLAENSEEFCEAVRHFYATLEDFHNKIRVVKVGPPGWRIPRNSHPHWCWISAGVEEVDLDEEVKLMPLAEDSEEFCEAVRHFYATLEDFHNKIHVVKVEKLIHPLLYKQYQLKKACMEKTCSTRNVEQVLFHGTTEQSSREICLHGFNRSFCGKNATLYGLGVYFAVNAVLSVQDKYSPCSADGSKYIFMAKTLTGDYAAGRKDMRAPPLKEASEAPLRYDSVVDNPRKPGIFVIFNDTQAYPQYLITCQRVKPPA